MVSATSTIGDDEYVVRIREGEGGVEVETVHTEQATDGPSPSLGAPCPRSVKEEADGGEGGDSDELRDDCKDVELTTVIRTVLTQSSTAAPSQFETPLSMFRQSSFTASATPTGSPTSALSSLSSSSINLYTPSALVGRSFTESVPSSAAPLSQRPMSARGSAAVVSPFVSASPFSAQAGLPRTRSVVNEVAMMTRQAAAAKVKVREDAAANDSCEAEERSAPAPLSLLASTRRLSESQLSAESVEATSANTSSSLSSSSSAASMSPVQTIGRCMSAPGTTALVAVHRLAERRDALPPLVSGESAPVSALSSTTSSPYLGLRSQTTTVIRPSVPSTPVGPSRVVPLLTSASSVLPTDYALLTPTSTALTLTSSPVQPSSCSSTTPPQIPRQRSVVAARSVSAADRRAEKARVEKMKQALSSLSVLVVDDTLTNLKIAGRFLSGIDCVMVQDGVQAVDAFKRRALVHDAAADSAQSPSAVGEEEGETRWAAGPPFSVILCDIVMPIMDGFETTRAIRRLEAAHGLAPVPIIAVTANCSQVDRRIAVAAGMDLLLAKPFEPAQLYEVIDIAVKKRKAEAASKDAGEAK